MERVNIPELLDTDACPPEQVEIALRDLGRINRWFGGVSISLELVRRVVARTGKRRLAVLEVAAGSGEVPFIVAQKLARDGISLRVTLLDRVVTHLPRNSQGLAGDASHLPFADNAFDVVSSNLFAHHLEPDELLPFIKESLRVSRVGVLINDLVRHPAHLALVYAGFAFMRCRVSRVDGLASVRRSYVPEEIRDLVAGGFPPASVPKMEIFQRPVFRMGVIVWK